MAGISIGRGPANTGPGLAPARLPKTYTYDILNQPVDIITSAVRTPIPQHGGPAGKIPFVGVFARNAAYYQPTIRGITRDSTGNPLPFCNVDLYYGTDPESLAADGVTSDAGGNFSFVVPASSKQYFLTAYLPGAPTVAGITLNNLTGS